jgi:hypothetical protein
MKTKWEDKGNNEILLEIKQLQLDHESLKMKIAREFDKLVEIEEHFNDAQNVIKERLNGNK